MVPVIPLLFCLLLPAAWASARVEQEKQDKLGFMNLAAGASVTASATCGVDEKGHSRPDLYCRFGGAVHDAERLTLQGQVCEVCEAGSTELSYPAESVTDGTDRGWQSPPLSLGSKYETVNLSLAFGQLFRVAKVSIWFGLAPRPRRWVIERSTDFGKTFSPWQFFAGSSKECVEYFGVPRSPLSQQGNEVICNTEYSNAPLENNLVVVSLLRSWKMDSTSNQLPLELRMFTQATDLRLRFLAMDTLPGHKKGKHERDPAIKRYYYYSVKEIVVLGSCECHDHASSCTALDRDDPFKFHCSCSHQTEGMNCERCKPGFYRQRTSPTAPNVCTPCQCHGPGTNGSCFAESGHCVCHTGFEGKSCEHCAHGYRGYPDCQMRSQKLVETWRQTEQHPNTKCACAGVGSLAGKCDPETGRCHCHLGFTGEHCDKCANGYFNFPLCQLCQCSPFGTTSQVCDQAGKCLCRSEVTGSQCDQCRSGYYTFPYCNVCDCDQVGAIGSVCGSGGQCECRQSVDGRRCDRCAAGHFSFPNCWRCECSQEGSISLECDAQSGECLCRSGVTGHRCDRCITGLFGFPTCQTHTCDPAGSLSTDHDNMDTCRCRTNVLGQTCSSCKPLFWNLQWENPTGCQSCDCNTNGTIGGYAECNQFTGQCLCKPGVTGRTCDQCLPGYYSSHGASYFGCQSCNCDAGGSVDLSCDAVTGACTCRPGVTGLKCNKLQPGFFLPGPQNWRYEAEAAVGPKGHQLRIENSMTGFTGTGYVTLQRSQVQAIWKVEVGFGKVSLFSVVLRCMTQNANPVLGKITLSPVNHPGSNQSHEVQILGGADDDWRSVSPSAEPFLLTPGEWELSIETTHLVLDSVLLLPSLQDLAGTPVFSRPFVQPCLLHPPANISTHLCVHYKHIPLDNMPMTRLTVVKRVRHRPSWIRFPFSALIEVNVETITGRKVELHSNIPKHARGQYVLLAEYMSLTGSPQKISVIENNLKHPLPLGIFHLAPCGYSFLCRTMLVKSDGRLSVLNITSSIKINIFGENLNLQQLKIFLVPSHIFSLELLTPQVHCFTHHGTFMPDSSECMTSQFVLPSLALRVGTSEIVPLGGDLTHGPVLEQKTPPAWRSKSKLFPLGALQDQVQLNSSLEESGQYMLIAHYFQPHSPNIPVNVSIFSGTAWQGSFNASFCPHAFGCRTMMVFGPSSAVRLRSGALSLILHPEKNMWLSYVLVVPESQFQSDLLSEEHFHSYEEFLSSCSYLDLSKSVETSKGFCAETAFSLVAYMSDGAKRCECDHLGSLSQTCQPHGGQCLCRPHVRGHTCDQCQPGFHSFPECRPCECSRGVCDQHTGTCTCPPHTLPHTCQACLPGTFAFHSATGCQPCKCHPQGAIDSLCHPLNGQCSCIKGVGGEQCDRCLPGFYSFPFCHQCDCNHNGTSPAICDTTTGHCLCKENVEGTRCDACIEGSFLLEASNPKGCTKCFCFGATNRCESTRKRRTQIVTMKGWSLHNIENRDVKMSTSPEEGVVKATLRNRGVHQNEIYWSAPDEFRGDRLASYGGELKFRVQSVGGQEERASWGLPDVVLKGNQLALAWSAPARTTNRSKPWEGRMLFLEENFHHLHSRGPVSREDLMVVLEDVHLLLVRSHAHTSPHQLLLSNVTLETTSSSGSGPVATRVERCLCPFHYRGDSCQECSSGCYREKRGPFLGSCRQCQCNGHSSTCTDGTGECLHCQHGAAGEHCETCRDEFLQADSPGNSSTSVSCFSCPCPMTMASNNFAIGCVRESGEIRCICKDGYTGVNCEKCDAGYFGNPMVVGSQCHPCKCNGNSAECDPFTGRCLNCRGHSAGFHCDHCATGYYADAIDRKHCKVCPCNSCGTASCHPKTGSCTCLPGVTGQLCNTCKEDHFGFGGCKGCKPCDCAEAALNSSCDLSIGQCVCAPGTHGQRCERCKKGFWNYGPKGCLRCNCPSDCCDPLTGACGCAPGLMGDQCDRCNKPGHIPMLNQNGQLLCDACDGCVKDLLSKLENSSNIVSQTESALQKLSVGSFTQTRLKNLNQEVAKAKTQLGKYTALVKKERKDVDLVDNHIIDLHMDMSSLDDKTNKTTLKMKDLEDAVQQMYTKAGISFDQVTQITQFVNDVVRMTTGGAMPGLPISSSEFQRQLAEAERLITKLRARNFNGLKDMALQEKKLADELLKQVQTEFQRRVQELGNEKTAASQLLDKHELLLDDILEAVNSARNATNYAESQNSANEDTLEQSKIHARQVRQLKDEAEKALDESEKKLKELRDLLNDFETTRMEFEKLAADMDATERPLSEHVNRLSHGASQEPLVQKAEEHARSLRDVAKQLESLVKNISKDEFVQRAIILSDTYANIVEMLRKAGEEANNALHAARSAELEVQRRELRRKAIDAKATSERLLRESQDGTKRKSLQDILDTAQQKANDAKQKLIDLQSNYRGVWDSLSRVNRDAIQRAIDAAQRDANYASRVAGEVEEELKSLNEEAEKLKANVSSNANMEFERALNETSRIINEAEKLIPQLLKKLSQVESIRDAAKATADINKVRDIIEEARRSANRVKVSMKFNGTSGVEVRLPKGLEDLRPYTSLEFYIQDMEPLNRGDDVPNEKQFLLYLGKKNTRSRREPQFSEGDYIGAYLENKQVVFVCNLGKGERSIRIANDTAKIMNDRFSMIRFERIYEMMTLEYKAGANTFSTKERGLPTDYLFDLNPANTMFYIGTASPIYDSLPPSLKLPNFKGYLELASVNENLASLYNFIKLYNMDTQKEVPAKRYKETKVAQDFYFEGTGFALLKLEQDNFFYKFEFQMRSTTYNGILLFLEKNELFLCAYIHEGHVKLEYNFGVGVKNVHITEIDRKIFGTIKIMVLPKKKEIKFEGTNMYSDLTMPDDFHLFDNLGDTAYIGGVPKDRIPDSVLKNLPVKNSFQGCIRNLLINKNVDLKQEQTNGVTFGCKDNYLVSRHATFSGKGFIKFKVDDFDNNHFEFGLTVQTDQPNGALISSNDGGLKLALLNGKVEFLFRSTKIVSPENVNDGYPHYIRVRYLSPESTGQGHVWLGVDNVEHQAPHKESFGKIDTTFIVGFDNQRIYPYFTGCMSNLYIESQGIDKVKDFNAYVEKSNVALERCPISTTRV